MHMTITERAIWQHRHRQQLADRLNPIQRHAEGTLFSEPSGNHHVVVTKEEGLICLWLHDAANVSTGIIQSEMNPAEPLNLVDAYTQAAFLGLLWNDAPTRIFTAGLGGGCLPTVLHHHLPQSLIQCVENDPVVVDAARQYFGFEPDATLRLAIDDASRWLETAAGRQVEETTSPAHFDMLVLDAFDNDGSVPSTLSTVAFFRLCRRLLHPTGVLVANLLYLDPQNAARIHAVATVFEHVYLLRMHDENDVLFASQQPLPGDAAILERASQIQQTHQFPFPFVRRAVKLKRVQANKPDDP